LASLTFAGETASGWQQATLSTPVAIAANTTYVVSYYAPAGGYAVNLPYFASSFNTPPLHALADGLDGPNGVYRYGASGFPTNTYQSSNYWVDVVFNTTAPGSPPTVTSVSPASGASGVAVGTKVTATFSKAMNAATISGSTFQLRDPANALVAATVTYDGTTFTATLQPTSPLATSSTYTATVT